MLSELSRISIIKDYNFGRLFSDYKRTGILLKECLLIAGLGAFAVSAYLVLTQQVGYSIVMLTLSVIVLLMTILKGERPH